MKIPEKYCCDICGKELATREIKRKIYVSTDCDWTEGRVAKPHLELMIADICDECMLKGTNFVADFQESNLRLKFDK